MYLPLCQAAGIVNESITIHPTPVPPLIIPYFTAFVKPPLLQVNNSQIVLDFPCGSVILVVFQLKNDIGAAMWNLEGLIVRGVYFDQPVEGVVTLSRVKYGGAVQHTVDLFHSITMFGQERTMVLLDANEIVHVEYESVIACEFD